MCTSVGRGAEALAPDTFRWPPNLTWRPLMTWSGVNIDFWRELAENLCWLNFMSARPNGGSGRWGRAQGWGAKVHFLNISHLLGRSSIGFEVASICWILVQPGRKARLLPRGRGISANTDCPLDNYFLLQTINQNCTSFVIFQIRFRNGN